MRFLALVIALLASPALAGGSLILVESSNLHFSKQLPEGVREARSCKQAKSKAYKHFTKASRGYANCLKSAAATKQSPEGCGAHLLGSDETLEFSQCACLNYPATYRSNGRSTRAPDQTTCTVLFHVVSKPTPPPSPRVDCSASVLGIGHCLPL